MCPWIPDPLSKDAKKKDSLRSKERNSCSFFQAIEGLPIHGYPSIHLKDSVFGCLWTTASSGNSSSFIPTPWPGFNVAIGRPVADDHYKLCLKVDVFGRPKGLEKTPGNIYSGREAISRFPCKTVCHNISSLVQIRCDMM